MSALILSASMISLFGQNDWQVIKKFNIATNFLEATGNSLMVAGSNSYYISTNDSVWNMFNSSNTILSGNIIDLDRNDNAFYISTDKYVYKQTDALNLFYTHPTNSITQIDFFKKDLMINEGEYGGVYLYKNNNLINLDYPSIQYIHYKWFIAADDSIALVGYDNNFQSRILNNSTFKWEIFAPTVYNWYYSYLNNKGIIIGVTGKAGPDIYFSTDYGKTFKKSSGSNPVSYGYNQKTTFEFANNTIYLASKGIHTSLDSGTTWKTEFKDSVFVDLKIMNNALYTLTNKGTLLKKSIYVLPDTLIIKPVVPPVDSIPLADVDSCILDYTSPIDTFYIKSHSIQNNKISFEWIIVQNKKTFTITSTFLKDTWKSGNILVYLTITCNKKKGMHSTTLVALYNLIITNIQENELIPELKFYPNPFTTQTILMLPGKANFTLTITDIQGRQVKQFSCLTGEKYILSGEGMDAGLYFYTLINHSNGKLSKGKLIVNK